MIVLPDDNGILQCADALRQSDLVGLPTETVYGLAGDATNDAAIAKIYETKNRPSFNPLIIHCADFEMARLYAEFDARADNLASVFWPGPLTLILPRKMDTKISLLAVAGLDTIAVRIPAHPAAQKLLKQFGRPVAAPSANPSGRLSPTTPAHVADFFKESAQPKLILAGGKTETGIESTILDLTTAQATLLRYGAIAQDEIENIIGTVIDGVSQTDDPLAVKSPGQLLRHYAPRTKLRLNASTVTKNEALITFGKDGFLSRHAKAALNLSEAGDLAEAAANLFAHLHALDQPDQFTSIAVMKIPNVGLGLAINDRLQRAANKD